MHNPVSNTIHLQTQRLAGRGRGGEPHTVHVRHGTLQALYCTALHCTVLCCAVLCCAVLWRVLRCVVAALACRRWRRDSALMRFWVPRCFSCARGYRAAPVRSRGGHPTCMPQHPHASCTCTTPRHQEIKQVQLLFVVRCSYSRKCFVCAYFQQLRRCSWGFSPSPPICM